MSPLATIPKANSTCTEFCHQKTIPFVGSFPLFCAGLRVDNHIPKHSCTLGIDHTGMARPAGSLGATHSHPLKNVVYPLSLVRPLFNITHPSTLFGRSAGVVVECFGTGLRLSICRVEDMMGTEPNHPPQAYIVQAPCSDRCWR